MDELTLRLSELENQVEELEKITGKLTVQLRNTEERLTQTVQLINSMQDTHHAICDAQKTMFNELRAAQRHLDVLTERTAQLDETADELEDSRDKTADKIQELSADIDQLYEDMNMLSKETRTRVQAMNRKLVSFFFDATGAAPESKPEESPAAAEAPKEKDLGW
jgi:chromosome segregation ATPase